MTTIQSWNHLRTAGALLQATKEATDMLTTLDGRFNSDEVYIRQDTIGVSNEVSLHLCENVLTDGSKTYDLSIT